MIGDWTISEITTDGTPVEVPDGALITLRLDGAEAGGTAACNSFGGQYRTEGDRMVLELFSTEMGCEAPLMNLEELVLGVFGASPRFTATTDSLTLTADSTVLRFAPTPEVEVAALVDNDWELSGFIEGPAASSRPGVERVHLLFAADGSLGGNAGCNGLRSTWSTEDDTLAGGALSIGEVAITRMSCGPEIDDLEQTVLAILAEADRYEIEGRRLVVWAGDDALDLRVR
ncbi:MAG: META domain-containing protein [Actinomycetia bacterium]|nr:META domain-containing protein [Actinomycetes bacterium]